MISTPIPDWVLLLPLSVFSTFLTSAVISRRRSRSWIFKYLWARIYCSVEMYLTNLWESEAFQGENHSCVPWTFSGFVPDVALPFSLHSSHLKEPIGVDLPDLRSHLPEEGRRVQWKRRMLYRSPFFLPFFLRSTGKTQGAPSISCYKKPPNRHAVVFFFFLDQLSDEGAKGGRKTKIPPNYWFTKRLSLFFKRKLYETVLLYFI